MKKKYLKNDEIEQEARSLQFDIWDAAGRPKDTATILSLFEPKNVIEYLGYKYREVENLGENRFNKGKYETAGAIDHTRELISISKNFKTVVMRFTAAHEAGHLVLHPNQNGLHRDLPIDSSKSGISNPIETQANKFATYLLMPEKLVLKEIIEILERIPGHEYFLSYDPDDIKAETTSIHFNEDLSFFLTGGNSTKLVSVEKDKLERESALASFRSGAYKSLAEIFKVSHKAITYRLDELGIVVYP